MSAEASSQRFLYIPTSALVFSVVLHLSLPLLIFGLKALDAFNFNHDKKNLKEVYQNFIQVDVVALPDAMLNDNQKLDTKLPMVDKPKSLLEEAKNQEDILALSHEKARLEKEREMAEKVKREKERRSEEEKALKKLQEDAKREQAMKSLLAKNGKNNGRAKMLGNKLSQGTAASGALGNLRDKYTAQVGQAIKEHFNIFPWQKKKKLSAVVHIEIFPNGKIKLRRLVKNSTDPSYDSAVLQAVDETRDLPVPEDPALVADGITVEMRPED